MKWKIDLYIKGCGVKWEHVRDDINVLYYPEIERTMLEQKHLIYTLEGKYAIYTTSPTIVESLARRQDRGEIELNTVYKRKDDVYTGHKTIAMFFEDIAVVFKEFREEDATMLLDE